MEVEGSGFVQFTGIMWWFIDVYELCRKIMGEQRGVREMQGVKYKSCQHLPRVLSFKLTRDYERMMQRVYRCVYRGVGLGLCSLASTFKPRHDFAEFDLNKDGAH